VVHHLVVFHRASLWWVWAAQGGAFALAGDRWRLRAAAGGRWPTQQWACILVAIFLEKHALAVTSSRAAVGDVKRMD